MTPLLNAGDTAWMLMATALVLLMVPGLALFYGGLVRGRHVLNTQLMTVAMLAVVGVQWVLAGYSFAFSPGGPLLGGLHWAGLAGVGPAPCASYAPTIPHLLFAGYQGLFAILTVALLSGGLVERMRFHAYLLFALLWTTAVYDPLARWVWSADGWLRRLGALDFAGGLVVHISAGAAALTAAALLGPRFRHPSMPHHVPMTLLGAGLLAVGWCGFNGGSAFAADGVAALALVNSLAAAGSALGVWMALEIAGGGRATAVGAATGLVVGLVGITPAAGFVGPAPALAIGALSAAASFGALWLKARLKADDALDVFACHGVAGISGALLTGVFATRAVNPAGADGLLAGHPGLLGIQALSVLVALAFTSLGTGAVLSLLRLFVPLRVGVAAELAGLDLGEHGQGAYWGSGVPDLLQDPLGEGVLLPLEELGVARDALERPLRG